MNFEKPDELAKKQDWLRCEIERRAKQETPSAQ
jgi:hypothetical protein